ncbi:MAG: transposase [Armatimonadetes bacterium]|nr:transposase [Armatimonadota bacterium]
MPRFLRSDNRGEFLARTRAVFLSERNTKPYFIKPGSPWQNGFIESFNSQLRAECLDVELFHNLEDAEIELAVYRRWYNEERPHSSIGHVAPATARAVWKRRSGYSVPPFRKRSLSTRCGF